MTKPVRRQVRDQARRGQVARAKEQDQVRGQVNARVWRSVGAQVVAAVRTQVQWSVGYLVFVQATEHQR